MVVDDRGTNDVHADEMGGWPPVVRPVLEETHSADYEVGALSRSLATRTLSALARLLRATAGKAQHNRRSAKLAATGVTWGIKAPVSMLLAPFLAQRAAAATAASGAAAEAGAGAGRGSAEARRRRRACCGTSGATAATSPLGQPVAVQKFYKASSRRGRARGRGALPRAWHQPAGDGAVGRRERRAAALGAAARRAVRPTRPRGTRRPRATRRARVPRAAHRGPRRHVERKYDATRAAAAPARRSTRPRCASVRRPSEFMGLHWALAGARAASGRGRARRRYGHWQEKVAGKDALRDALPAAARTRSETWVRAAARAAAAERGRGAAPPPGGGQAPRVDAQSEVMTTMKRVAHRGGRRIVQPRTGTTGRRRRPLRLRRGGHRGVLREVRRDRRLRRVHFRHRARFLLLEAARQARGRRQSGPRLRPGPTLIPKRR